MSLPSIDTIPPELCTRDEAAEILGLGRSSSLTARTSRFRKLRFARVRHNGTTKILYNRAEVERYKYPEKPEGYVDTTEAAAMLGFQRATTAVEYLRKMGIPRKLMKASKPYYVYEKAHVEALSALYVPTQGGGRKRKITTNI
jgi:hypothetical protein